VSSSKRPSGQNGSGPVDPASRPSRRSFTAEYKAAVVAEYEAAAHGEKSAVLRREGLFHSHVQEWTRARGAAVTPANTNGAADTSATTARLSRAERETERLRAENARERETRADAGRVVDHGKAHELLASLAESTDTPPSSSR
jgi:transposase-like protein